MFLNFLLASFTDRVTIGEDKYYAYEDVWADYAKDYLVTVYLYAAIAIAVILVAVGIFVKMKKNEAFASYLKTAAAIVLAFAAAVIVTMLGLGFAKISEKGYAQEANMLLELIPPLVTGAVAVIGIVAIYVSSFFSEKARKLTVRICVGAIIAALVATFICLAFYYSDAIKDDGYYDDADYGQLNQVALYVSAAAFVVIAVVAAFLLDRKGTFNFEDSNSVAFAGITVALSFALSYIKFFEMPQGGSITLASLLPVMLFAYVYGPKKGLFVGMIYGMLQAMQDPWIIHPAQFLLDYPVAFAMVGFAGLFRNVKALDKVPQVKFALGAILAAALRFFAHVLSGVFAFGAYAMDAGQENFWIYSTAYNSFVFVDLILVIVVGALLFSSKSFNRSLARYNAVKVKAEEQ